MRRFSTRLVPFLVPRLDTRQRGSGDVENPAAVARPGGSPAATAVEPPAYNWLPVRLTFAFSGGRGGATMWDTSPPSVESTN